jgi:hypothetical protein
MYGVITLHDSLFQSIYDAGGLYLMLEERFIGCDPNKSVNSKHNQEGRFNSKDGIVIIIDHNSVIEYKQTNLLTSP